MKKRTKRHTIKKASIIGACLVLVAMVAKVNFMSGAKAHSATQPIAVSHQATLEARNSARKATQDAERAAQDAEKAARKAAGHAQQTKLHLPANLQLIQN